MYFFMLLKRTIFNLNDSFLSVSKSRCILKYESSNLNLKENKMKLIELNAKKRILKTIPEVFAWVAALLQLKVLYFLEIRLQENFLTNHSSLTTHSLSKNVQKKKRKNLLELMNSNKKTGKLSEETKKKIFLKLILIKL